MSRTVLLAASTVLALLLACGVLLAGAEKPAQAAFPGTNGKIVFSNNGDIFSMNPDGSGQKQLTNNPGSDEFPAVSPDGTRIAFASTRDGGDYDIYVMDADGGNHTNLTNTPSVQEVRPSWSPDGKKMAFDRYEWPGEVWTMDADGSDRAYVAGGFDPDWSPDGTKIAFHRWTDHPDYPDDPDNGYSALYTVSPDGSDRAYVSGGSEPDWSPDGTKITAKSRDTGAASSVFTINADGSGEGVSVYRMGNEIYEPSWSPDGTKIVFGVYGDGSGITVSEADGSDRRTLPVYSESLDWGPAPTDAPAPVVNGPTRNLVVGSVIGDSTTPVGLTWSATNVGGSGVARYELQRSTNGGAFANVVLPSQLSTAVTESLGAGKSYQYRVRAQDRAGNWSAWKTGPAFVVDLRQEDHQAVSYSGAWALRSSPTASGGYVKYASAPGAKARFSFAGKNVAWVASTGSNRGKAEVWVDGVKAATVDLYSATAQPRKMLFTKSWGTSGNHVLEVRVLGTKNASSSGKQVDVDAFVALR